MYLVLYIVEQWSAHFALRKKRDDFENEPDWRMNRQGRNSNYLNLNFKLKTVCSDRGLIDSKKYTQVFFLFANFEI